jgi:hypothetical protein
MVGLSPQVTSIRSGMASILFRPFAQERMDDDVTILMADTSACFSSELFIHQPRELSSYEQFSAAYCASLP